MNIKILFDNETANEEFSGGWGLSALIDEHILFDTGEQGSYLLHNMALLNVPVDSIEMVVISHDHWDHTGGLWAILERREGIEVFACPGFGDDFKRRVGEAGARLREVAGHTQIAPDIYLTGELAAHYKGEYLAEQSLIARTSRGLVIVTGCSHPGILRIAEEVRRTFPQERIHLAIGGFHLMKEKPQAIRDVIDGLKRIGVVQVGPTHCTGETAQMLFREAFGTNSLVVGAGQSFEV